MNKCTMMTLAVASMGISALSVNAFGTGGFDERQRKSCTPPHKRAKRGKLRRGGK